jgi:4-aminobutyrate aminotransferase-like enzyme
MYTRNTTPAMPRIVAARGARIECENGREYVDLCSQTLNLNLGHCHPGVEAAVGDALESLTFASSRFSTRHADALAKRLVEAAPGELARVNLKCVSGSDANEAALKSVRKQRGRLPVLSFIGSHHGQTFETMRVSGKHFDCSYLQPRGATFLDAPHCYRCPLGKNRETCSAECLDPAERELSTGEYAAVLIEPIMVDAGVLVPPSIFHRRLRSLCNDYGAWLIYDEVQTAFGWLGTTFAMQFYDVAADACTLGKGLGAGWPLAALLVRPELDVLGYGEHELTYGAHPISCVAALVMLGELENGLLARARALGDWVAVRLRELRERHPMLGDARGAGLLWGLEFVDPQTGEPAPTTARRVFAELFEAGYLLRMSQVGGCSNVLQFKPPLIVTETDIDGFFVALDRVLTTGS